MVSYHLHSTHLLLELTRIGRTSATILLQHNTDCVLYLQTKIPEIKTYYSSEREKAKRFVNLLRLTRAHTRLTDI